MRVAVVAGSDPGHALPALGVAAALRGHGHDAWLHTGAEHAASAAAHGVPLVPLPRLPPAAAHRLGFGERMWARAAELAPPLVAAWSATPDLVVVDTLTRGGAFAAELVDRPWVELIGHHLPDPAFDLPPVGMGRPLPRTPWRRADDRRIVARQHASYAEGAAQRARAAASLGLRSVAPAIRLLATLPSLERPREMWPSDAHVVGPLAVDPAGPELPPPAGDAPLVVITDSTASGVERSLGAVALEALVDEGLRLAVTSTLLPPARRATSAVGPGPHRPLLAGAALAVGYGGGGFVGKALAAGVPLVVVPLQGDQPEAAARLRDVGVGRPVSARRLTPRGLRRAVRRHLDDERARDAARRLAAEAASLGPDVVVGLLEAVATGQRPHATGPRHHLPIAATTGRGTSRAPYDG